MDVHHGVITLRLCFLAYWTEVTISALGERREATRNGHTWMHLKNVLIKRSGRQKSTCWIVLLIWSSRTCRSGGRNQSSVRLCCGAGGRLPGKERRDSLRWWQCVLCHYRGVRCPGKCVHQNSLNYINLRCMLLTVCKLYPNFIKERTLRGTTAK